MLVEQDYKNNIYMIEKLPRKEAIISMYDYRGIEEKQAITTDNEIIDNWYIEGFDDIKKLEPLFNIEHLYDYPMDAKVIISDIEIILT